MKRNLTLTLALAFAASAQAQFTPIPLAPESYNQDVVVEQTAPPPLSSAVTATMDGGTNKTGNTFYERGYNTNAAALDTGMPPAGSLLANAAGTRVFQLPPDYHANNAVLVGRNAGAATPLIPAGTLTLTTPAPFGALSFLNAAGNGPVRVRYVIHYADTSTEEGVFISLDWFNNDNAVYTNRGRINIGTGAYDVRAVGERAAQLYAADIFLGNPAANVARIDFFYDGSGGNGNTNNNGRTAIFAVAGSPDAVNYTPVAVTGFNYDVVMEADGPLNTPMPAGVVTATMDGGTSLLNNTWYERGYHAAAPNTGLPAPGASFTSTSLAAQFTMPASYNGNCAVFLASNVPTANISFATPAAYGSLAFLCAGANGATTIPCVIEFQDGTTETNAITVLDWFNRTDPWAYLSFGRVLPATRSLNQTPDQFVNPFAGPVMLEPRGLATPVPRLFNAVINVTNSSVAITNIALNRTNGVTTATAAIFAVSGAPAASVPPVLATQPGGAVANNVTMVKTWEGTNNVTLSVTTRAGTAPVTYQWKKAPRGTGWSDWLYTIDYAAFSDVVDGGRISGATTSSLVISNATLADTADYLVIASNPHGSFTSFVATVMVLTTNQSILVGLSGGDTIAGYTGEGAPAAESVDHAIDRVAQKWLSWGQNNQVLPFTGPVGFVVTPVSGDSIVTSIRFYAANDTLGRDPKDYTLEGSNDGGGTWNHITGGVLKGSLIIPTARNGTGATALNPLTQSVLEVDFANTTGYRSYRFTITNTFDRFRQALMQTGEIELLGTLVPNPPVWTRQPVSSATVYAGASPTFGVSASGYPPPTYQWYRNGTTLITDATNSTYTLVGAQLGDSGATFHCVANNIFGSINSTAVTLTVISPPTEPYPAAILADNPIAYWRLNEGPDDGGGNVGLVARDYRGGRNGTYLNAVVQVPGYNPTADADRAAQFGTPFFSDSRVSDIQGLSFAASNATVNFSVEAWLNGPAQTAGAGVITKGTGGGGEQFNLDFGGAGNGLRFFYRDAAGVARLASSSVTLNSAWHHVVGVVDQANGEVLLYVDGVLAASGLAPAGSGALNTLSPVSIGARQSGATDFNMQFVGVIDDVAVYNYALSPSQVLNHFYAGQYPPVFSYGPTNTTVNEGGTAIFYSSAYGPGPITYQWYNVTAGEPGVPVPGPIGTSNNLVLSPVTLAMNGSSYRVAASNPYGSVTNPDPNALPAVQLTINSGPPFFITDLPASSVVYAGRTLTLTVETGGTEPISYQWQRNSVNLSDGGRVSGVQTRQLQIANAQTSDTGVYQVHATSTAGGPVSSSLSSVFVQSVPQLNTNGAGWTLNGTPGPATITDGVLTLTVGAGNTARSAFYAYPMFIGAFEAGFTYQELPGAGAADGMAFVLHNDPRGTTALGGGGGSLGYSGITPSAAVLFNVYAPNTIGIALSLNGAIPAAGGYTVTTPLNVASGNRINARVRYVSGGLQLSLTDAVTAATFVTNVAINLPAVLGSQTAYVGFTGADGGVVSTQTISNFTFVPLPTLALQSTGPGTVQLTWPTSIGGYVVQSNRVVDAGPWVDVPTTTNGELTVPVSDSDSFFRLRLVP